MQVNAIQAQINSLHSAYNSCLKTRMSEYLAMDAAARKDQYSQGMNEFCTTEKQQYLRFMEVNAPVEYKNILRLEEGNYWTFETISSKSKFYTQNSEQAHKVE